jgi:dTDP-4-dehydrorhamnose 3,5-epimerase
MKLLKNVLNGVLVFKLNKYKDQRGYFKEAYNQINFDKLCKKKTVFVQDNISVSKSGVIRGLHYQSKPFEQGKLVTVLRGKIFDVAVDLRKNSKFYGKYFSIILSEKNNKQLWIPAGFAHGFMSLQDETIVKYNTSKRYSPKHERTLLWNDKKINIKWPDFKTKTISMKDSKLISNKYD